MGGRANVTLCTIDKCRVVSIMPCSNLIIMNTQAKNMLIESFARGRETVLITRYIDDGPTALREELGLEEDGWRVLFDYLTFKHALVYKCVTSSRDFFIESYIKHGSTHVREILDIVEDKYDDVWQMIFDFLAIANKGLEYHVIEHRERYMTAFKVRGGDFARKVLGIWGDKYDEHWGKVLNLLLHAVCDDHFDEQHYDNGVRLFTSIANVNRVRRGLV